MRKVVIWLAVVVCGGGAGAGQPPEGPVRAMSPEELVGLEAEALENPIFRAWGPGGPPDEVVPPPPGPPASGEVRDAYERWLEEEVAPAVGIPEGKVYPFGMEVPEVIAVPGWTTDIRLEKGERIESYYFGDPQGWESAEALEGGPGGTPHVLIRPTFFGKRTNLVIVTDRRSYHVRLTVPAEAEAAGKEVAFEGSVSWYYPQAWRREGAQRARAAQAKLRALEEARAKEPQFTQVAVDALRYGYHVEVPRKRKHRLDFRPRAVFDDGERTFVLLPEGMEEQDLPAFLLLGQDDTGRPVESHRESEFLVLHAVGSRWQVIANGRSLVIERESRDE